MERTEREREKERHHEGFENDVYKENAQIFPLDGHLHNNAFLSRCFLGQTTNCVLLRLTTTTNNMSLD